MAKTLQTRRIAAVAAFAAFAVWGSQAIAGEVAQPVMLPAAVITAPAIARLEVAVVTAPTIQHLPVAVITAPAPATQIAAR